jgi:hypothetical protein
LRFLREQTGVHVHADLIVGLPGEDVASFARGFDRLVAMRPQEIQVGMLKRLRGTPIVRHDVEWGMTYSPNPPYEILSTKLIEFPTMQRMRRFARYWDLVANSGNFIETTPLIWRDGQSPFGAFIDFTDWLFARAGRKHAISLANLTQYVFEFLTREKGGDVRETAESLWLDYQRGGRSDMPPCLKPHVERTARPSRTPALIPRRQARRLAP